LARKTSPFAALTSEQKQMKWMEYQSIRLPYTNAEPLPVNEEREPKRPADTKTQSADTCQNENPKLPSPDAVHPQAADFGAKRPMPPPEVYAQTRSAASHTDQKTRHQQYDAVIARMKQAELRTGSYRSWSQ